MKTFEDLVFEPWLFGGHAHARMDFENGYGVSVVFGEKFYSNGIDTYELAVMFEGERTYNTPITDDVLAYITADEVTATMEAVQKLPKA